MTPREARRILEEARQWADEGLLGAEALSTIETRYAPLVDQEGDSLPVRLLYALGGLLLGAAAIALVVFADVSEAWRAPSLFALGLVGLAAGGALMALRQEGFTDAAFLAGLVPMTFAAAPFTEGTVAYAVAAAAAPLVVLGLRHHQDITAAAAAAAFAFALPLAVFQVADQAGDPDGFSVVWWIAMAGATAGALLLDRFEARFRGDAVAAIAAVGMAAATLGVTADWIDPSWDGAFEVILGAVELGLLAVGLTLRQKGLIVGSSAVVIVDAIVFAFHVGNELWGLATLVAFALVLFTQARLLRRWLRD